MDQPNDNTEPWHRMLWPLLPVTAFQPLSATVHVEIAARCHPGKIKPYNEERIENVLVSRHKPDEQCRALIDLALESGGTDNITVVLAQYAMPQP